MDALLSGSYYALITISMLAIPLFTALLVWGLAKLNMFWTIMQEAQAKAVVVNGKFSHLLMSYHGHVFKGETDEELKEWTDKWDVIPVKNASDIEEGPKWGGLRWVGFWPFVHTYEYRFTWTSIEQRSNETEAGATEMVAVTSEKKIDYVLLQWDLYGLLIKTVETKEILPVDILLLMPAQVVNPYKALFRVQHWLEQSENMISDRVRGFVGTLEFKELIQRALSDEEEKHKIDDEELKGVLKDILNDFGVKIPYVGIRRVDPGSSEAKEFIKASGAVFVADQRAEAARKEGAGLRDRAKAYYEIVSGIEGGVQMFTAEAIRDSKLQAIAPNLMPQLTLPSQENGKEDDK